MMDLLIVTLGVCLGTLLACCAVIGLMCNKKVVKAYMRWVSKMSREVVEELFNEDE